jgi:uncharacterized membrane protein
MRHYSSKRSAVLRHRFRGDLLGLVVFAAVAAGAVYVVVTAPPLNASPWLEAIGRIPDALAALAPK